jgi:hypothetical protein
MSYSERHGKCTEEPAWFITGIFPDGFFSIIVTEYVRYLQTFNLIQLYNDVTIEISFKRFQIFD